MFYRGLGRKLRRFVPTRFAAAWSGRSPRKGSSSAWPLVQPAEQRSPPRSSSTPIASTGQDHTSAKIVQPGLFEQPELTVIGGAPKGSHLRLGKWAEAEATRGRVKDALERGRVFTSAAKALVKARIVQFSAAHFTNTAEHFLRATRQRAAQARFEQLADTAGKAAAGCTLPTARRPPRRLQDRDQISIGEAGMSGAMLTCGNARGAEPAQGFDASPGRRSVGLERPRGGCVPNVTRW